MSLGEELGRHFPDHFRVLVLDNEVTVDAFVTSPALPWARLVAVDGTYRVADGYPSALSAEEADREELNWDIVALDVLSSDLGALDDSVDLVAMGNNAGQGLAFARAIPETLRAAHGAVIYGSSLAEQADYEAAGYRQFCRRDELIALAGKLAAGRPVALGFINTIEHDEDNYHSPEDWAANQGSK